MFARVSTVFFFLFFALPLVVSATAIQARTGGDDCNTGNIYCCNISQTANTVTQSDIDSLGLGIIGGLLYIAVQALGNILIGLSCNGISLAAIHLGGCSASPVCCTGNTFNGLINIGCTSITV